MPASACSSLVRMFAIAGMAAVSTACATNGGITVKGADDALSKKVEITSNMFFLPANGYPDPVDYYFVSNIVKATGETNYQISYAVNSDSWRNWDTLTVDTGGQTFTSSIIWTGEDMSCTDYGCHYAKLGTSPLSREQLQAIASATEQPKASIGSPKTSEALPFKLLPQEAQEVLDRIAAVSPTK
ncbi:MAG: hypothetical protein CL581_17775 [Alteromonadaceae bacterium]|nr:hypothetical protein [Alteromonadaceae bacterium]MBH84106.1 hypothetical protein [Alteromonadaceae bacterium]|tara:strand:- start:19759 stop:20313 length:555 start_codon:yes stop_codon:yes gene_type:complete